MQDLKKNPTNPTKRAVMGSGVLGCEREEGAPAAGSSGLLTFPTWGAGRLTLGSPPPPACPRRLPPAQEHRASLPRQGLGWECMRPPGQGRPGCGPRPPGWGAPVQGSHRDAPTGSVRPLPSPSLPPSGATAARTPCQPPYRRAGKGAVAPRGVGLARCPAWWGLGHRGQIPWVVQGPTSGPPVWTPAPGLAQSCAVHLDCVCGLGGDPRVPAKPFPSCPPSRGPSSSGPRAPPHPGDLASTLEHGSVMGGVGGKKKNSGHLGGGCGRQAGPCLCLPVCSSLRPRMPGRTPSLSSPAAHIPLLPAPAF